MDILRTYQNNYIFQIKKNRTMLIEVLFIWSKKHSNISYRQGMNELIGVLFITLQQFYFPNNSVRYEDLINKQINCNPEDDEFVLQIYDKYISDLFLLLHDIDYLDADLFILFEELMERGIKEFYDDKDMGDVIKNNERNLHLNQIVTDKVKELFRLSWNLEGSGSIEHPEVIFIINLFNLRKI